MNIWIIVASVLGGLSLLGILSWIFKWGIGEVILEFLGALTDAASALIDAIGDINIGD